MNALLYQFLGLVLGFALWAALGIMGEVPLDPLIALLQMALGGLITHMLKSLGAQDSAQGDDVAGALRVIAQSTATSARLAQTAAVEGVPPVRAAESGFISLRLLAVLASIALGLSLLAGCAGFQQALTGYESAAKKGIEAANDNQIEVLKTLFCAQPLSAILRNPNVIPALKALCLPGGNALDPNGLFGDTKQPITINLTVPPAAAASAPTTRP